MDKFSKGIVLGRGTFGEVIKATHNETGQVVAIKKIRIGEKGEGVNVTALREVKFLKELNSQHIVRLLDVFPQKRGISLVFEFMETDLEMIIKDRSRVLSAADIKAYMQMVLQGLAVCHTHWIVHRDIKPNNFLVAASGELKLGDFGLARLYGSPERKYTNQVFARWYRPPELFYGSTCYGPSVDVWAAGCIFAELMLRRPWFPGESDSDVLAKIFMSLGTPTDESWGGLRHMPAFVEFTATPAPGLKTIFPAASEDALDLLSRMMAFDASRRISAKDALQHRFFRTDPLPTPSDKLPRPRAAEPQGTAAASGAGGGAATTAATAVGIGAGEKATGGELGGVGASTHLHQKQQQQQQQQGVCMDVPPQTQPPPQQRGGLAQQASTVGPSRLGLPQDSAGVLRRSGMSTVVKRITLDTGGQLQRVKAAGQPCSTGGGSAVGEGVTPQDVTMVGGPGIGESALGRLLRPKLDSGDIRFLRKRKMQLDEALEEAGQADGENGGS